MKSTGDLKVLQTVVATGICSVVTQLLIVRECLAQFQGNEFVIALTLFNWLILGGFGTLAARVMAHRVLPVGSTQLGWLSMALAGLSVVQIFAIRRLRDLVFIHGASVGFYPTLAYTLGTMAPYGLLVGFVLPYSLFVLRSAEPDYPGARIYMADNIGDVAGGALFAFVLVHFLTPFQGIFLAGLPLVLCAWRLFPRKSRLPVAGTAAAAALAVLAAGVVLEPGSLAPVHGQLVDYRETRYGRLTVHRDSEQVTLFADGMPVSSGPDPVAAEEAVHYPLAQVAEPERVLLISASSGMMAELDKYNLKSVDYVEIDPEVSRLQFQFGLLRPIAGLKPIHQDGRAFLQATETRYDAIVVSLPEPETFQANRFFTSGFFALASAHLTPDGVLGFSVQGYDNYLGEPQRQKISSLYRTVSGFFNHVLMLPGQKIYFLCSRQPLDTDMVGLLAEKKIATRYIQRYYDGNLTAERIRQLNELVDPDTAPNTDAAPRLMRIMFTQWFDKFSASPRMFMAVVCTLGLIYLTRLNRETFVLFSTGFMVMGSEILVIFAFQIFFGYVYLKIGLIVTVFLAGLMPGAWLGYRIRNRPRRALVFTDAVLIVLVLIYVGAVSRTGSPAPAAFYLGFGFFVSMLCGTQFPLVLRMRGDDDTAATAAFSADLMGAAFGVLVTSTVLLPFVGIGGTAAGLIVLKFVSLVCMGIGYGNSQPA